MAKVSRLVVMRGGGGKRLLDLGERGVGELQGLEHVDVPVEEEADLGGAAEVVLRTVSRPGTLLTASSMGLVMVTCICSTGMTPLSTPMTTRGNWYRGRRRWAPETPRRCRRG